MDIKECSGINVWIDELVPCLKDTKTNEIKQTIATKMTKSQLKGFNKRTGWHVNWAKLPKDVEIYAVALKENLEIQGLIGIKNDPNAVAAYIQWACTAPHNNVHDNGMQSYSGVGGHLFAIAADMSKQWGYEGVVYGIASDEKILEHYVSVFHAEGFFWNGHYQFIINENAATELMEVYDYEWN